MVTAKSSTSADFAAAFWEAVTDPKWRLFWMTSILGWLRLMVVPALLLGYNILCLELELLGLALVDCQIFQVLGSAEKAIEYLLLIFEQMISEIIGVGKKTFSTLVEVCMALMPISMVLTI